MIVFDKCIIKVPWHGMPIHLTHLAPNKLDTISQKIFPYASRESKDLNLIKISFNFVPGGPMDNNPALV